MNIPLALETAMAETIRAKGSLVPGVVIRTWQSLRSDGSIDRDGSRQFPMIDIRATPPMSAEDQTTLHSTIAIECKTLVDDDLDHIQIQQLYAGVQDVCDEMFGDFRIEGCTPNTGTALHLFLQIVQAQAGAFFQFGGLTFEDPLAPFDDDGRNSIGISMRVHYSRSDW
jgi:hypothetical protein